MFSLTADSIKDYQTCARLFDYRYQTDIHEPVNRRVELVDRFETTLKKVAAFFFYKKQGGTIPSYAALLNRWERLWFPKGMTPQDILVEQHDSVYKNLASFTTDAATALMHFHDRFAADEGEPFLVDEHFSVPLDKDIKIEGSIDLALRYRKQNAFVVMKWVARGKKPSMSTYEMDFAITKHAFEYKTKHMTGYKTTYGVYDLASSSPGLIPADIRDEDINTLKYWSREIMSDDIYPSRRGLTSYCKSCPFDRPCSEWKIPLKAKTA